MTADNRFAQWLDVTMANRRIKGRILADKLGVDDSAVSRWRNGRSVPSLETLMKLATVLNEDPIRLAVTAGLMDPDLVNVEPLPLPPPRARREHVREQIKAIKGLDREEISKLLAAYDEV